MCRLLSTRGGRGIQSMTDTQAPGKVDAATALSGSDGSATVPLSLDQHTLDVVIDICTDDLELVT